MTPPTPAGGGWSLRARLGNGLNDLVGLAFSGGGIRSATFNLGVLEGLKSLDLLRKIDYLSTVSGGGYIGAWLMGNVRRTPYWLSRTANWDESIGHLRQYSNYLSPMVGFLSADTWTMAGIWVRNTFLIQLVVFSAIASLIVATRLTKVLFDFCSGHTSWVLPVIQGLLIWPAIALVLNLYRNQGPPGPLKKLWLKQGGVQWFIVVPLWLTAFLIGATLWASARKAPFDEITGFSGLLFKAWGAWWKYLILSVVSLFALGVASIRGKWYVRVLGGMGTALVGTVALYLTLCGLMRLFQEWIGNPAKYGWYAFVWSPPLVLFSLSITIVIFLGLLSRNSLEWTREWWTRLGAWLGIYGTGCIVFALVTVYGPLLVANVMHLHPTVRWPAVLGWLATTGGGLLAGKGGSTKGDGGSKTSSQAAKEFLAKAGGVLFIAGMLVAIATLLHIFFVIYSNSPGDVLKNGEAYWSDLTVGTNLILMTWLVLLASVALVGWRFDVNVFSLNSFYRNRLVRCYLGATRWAPGIRQPQPFTCFDEADDLPLAELRVAAAGPARFRGPFPIINSALNLGGSSDLALHTRHSASFTLTPLSTGSDRRNVGYMPTAAPTLGQAISVSGAAASPNMGYHTSPIVAFLLTLFNVRLGWWFPNPGKPSRSQSSPRFGLKYLVSELFGMAGEQSRFVNLSDGGHFENLGVYELVRRRCKVIIASDSECDPDLTFESLGNLIRICDVDFGARIRINVDSLRKHGGNGGTSHCAVGLIDYSNGSQGYLIYLKSSLTGDEDSAVLQYKAGHPAFPHETTADQFFAEDQFESYRRLGRHVVERAFRDVAGTTNLLQAARTLHGLWTPAVNTPAAFIVHTKALDEIWERLRASPQLVPLRDELLAGAPSPFPPAGPTTEETCLCAEIIQLMENVYLELRLDDHWDHPDNRGWRQQLLAWAKSGTFRAVWARTKETYGLRFQHFCRMRLGLL